MFAMYGDICHLCHHHGARQADLVIPASYNPEQILQPGSMLPAHGAGRRSDGTDNPCPVCGLRCNTVRGNRPIGRTRAALGSSRRKAEVKPSRKW